MTLVGVDQAMPVQTDRTPTRSTRGKELQLHLAVIRGMLDSLQTLTLAGQRHTMDKVTTYLAEKIEQAGALGARNQTTLAQMLAGLREEARRPLPSTEAFRQGVELLLTLVTSATATASRAGTA